MTRAEYNARFGAAHKTPLRPDPPGRCRDAWDAFWRLSSRRHSGPEPISLESIESYTRLTGKVLDPQDVEWIEHMDEAFLAEVAKEREDEKARAEERREVEQMQRKR